MMTDPIIEDVRSARQRIFEACGEDLDALPDRFREQEKLDQERVVKHLEGKSLQEQLEYWQKGTEDLQKLQESLKKRR